MRFVELLARIDPGTSGFIAQMQNEGKDKSAKDVATSVLALKSTKCLACRGKGKVKESISAQIEAGVHPERVNPQKMITCEKCLGAKMPTTHGKETRSKGAPSLMAMEQISFCAYGMDDHLLRAATYYATGSFENEVIASVYEKIVLPDSESWGKTLPEPAKDIRRLGVARCAVTKMRLPRNEMLMPSKLGAYIMCCHQKDWRRRWEERAMGTHEKLEGWVLKANDHMSRRYYEIDDAA